jgi:hypothetical protein
MKMKKRLVFCLTLLSLTLILFSGCSAIVHVAGTGKIVEKSYDFKDFTGVEVSDAIKYEVRQSDSYSLVVSTHENLVEHLDVYQSGKTVYIGLKPGLFQNADTRAMVTLPQLNKLVISGSSEGSASGFSSGADLEIKVSGASDLDMSLIAGETGLDISGSSEVKGELTAADTQIKLSGASDLDMKLKTAKTGMDLSGSSEVNGNLQSQDIRFKLTGASKCELTGSAGDALIDASGSSDMYLSGLVLHSADVKLSGASYAAVHTDGKLNIDLSGSSTLDYTGNPAVGKIDVSGASEVNSK